MKKPRIPYHKLPHFITDAIDELRDRQLLPIVIALAAAIVAVPVLLSHDGSTGVSPLAPAGAGDASALATGSKSFAVVADDPGLRDYRKRLDKLAAKNPFKQQYNEPLKEAAALGETLSTSIGETSSGGSTVVGGTTGGAEDDGGGSKSKTVVKTKYLSYPMDIALGEFGALKRYDDVEALSFLPSQKVPALVFLGVGGNGSKALFLVSSDVSSISGKGICVPSSSTPCNVLVMRTGQIEDLVYGPNGKSYRLKVLSIRRSSTG
jgi:hypothetical protein